jgi:hypothetical protein
MRMTPFIYPRVKVERGGKCYIISSFPSPHASLLPIDVCIYFFILAIIRFQSAAWIRSDVIQYETGQIEKGFLLGEETCLAAVNLKCAHL